MLKIGIVSELPGIFGSIFLQFGRLDEQIQRVADIPEQILYS